MKKLFSIMLLCFSPLLLTADDAKTTTPKKRTISSYRIVPKDGHDSALKAAIAAHANAFHTGSWKWRVYQVLTGPETSSYMILEGPNSWTAIEGRGGLSPGGLKDYEDNILPHVEK